MYGKIFASMYDGSLRTKSPWQALVTFQQMIVLANKHGEVDMTAEALSFRTGIPLDIIQAGIEALEAPDPDSRSNNEDGRRIVRVSDSRSWGWQIVNYAVYREMRSAEERREYMRLHMQAKRAKTKKPRSKVDTVSQPLAPVSNVSQGSKQYAEGKAESISSSTDKERLIESLPTDVMRVSWRAEMNGALQGMHGRPLTAEQLELACRDFLGNGASASPTLDHFRAYLRRAGKPRENLNGKRQGDASLILASIRDLIQTNQAPGQAAIRFIPRAKVAALGKAELQAYDAIGGADRVLAPDPQGFALRDFTQALEAARAKA